MINALKSIVPSKVKIALRNVVLSGNDVECPICEKTFVTFLPFGLPPNVKRPNAMCPNCFSLERTRIYWKYLQKQPKFFNSNSSVLHVAPERGLFNKFSSNPNLNYFPVDKFMEGYSYPKGTINMDITALEFPENTFDFILCSHVLEHIHDDAKAISELFRVLKPGGWGILQVPIEMDREHTYEDDSIQSPEERKIAFGQYDHVRRYGRDYSDRLAQSGFVVEQDDYAFTFSEAEKFRFGFGAGEDLFIVRKTATKA